MASSEERCVGWVLLLLLCRGVLGFVVVVGGGSYVVKACAALRRRSAGLEIFSMPTAWADR